MMNQIDQQLNADLLRLSEIYKQETYTQAQITEASTIISNLQEQIEVLYVALDMFQEHFETQETTK